MNNLGANIRARRHELGITQEQLSNNTGLSINYISRLEVGTANNVSAKTLSHIAEVLKTSMDKLMHGSTDKAEMGFYQKKLWQALNEMDEKQAEQVSKNVLVNKMNECIGLLLEAEKKKWIVKRSTSIEMNYFRAGGI